MIVALAGGIEMIVALAEGIEKRRLVRVVALAVGFVRRFRTVAFAVRFAPEGIVSL